MLRVVYFYASRLLTTAYNQRGETKIAQNTSRIRSSEQETKSYQSILTYPSWVSGYDIKRKKTS